MRCPVSNLRKSAARSLFFHSLVDVCVFESLDAKAQKEKRVGFEVVHGLCLCENSRVEHRLNTASTPA